MTYHIMLIEDDPVTKKVVHETLKRRYGYEVTSFETAQKAMEYLIDNPTTTYDLIITDLEMRGMDGHDFIEVMKSGRQIRFNDIPIIIITGYFNPENIVKYQSHVCAILEKPVDGNILDAKIREVLK